MQLPLSFDAIVKEPNAKELYSKLILQLNKDLLLANIDLQFNEEVLPTSLKLIFKDCIYDLLQNKFSEYLNLLYVIDVAESKIKVLDSTDLVGLSEAVTFLMLQREWQKVWYKQRYSSSL